MFIGLSCFSCVFAQDARPFLEFKIGQVTIHPSGFFDEIAQFRTEPTGESISTHFGRIPLADGPSEWVSSPSHSRLQTKGWTDLGAFRLTGYYEMDFQGTNIPYRVRQAFGELQNGKWRFLAGRAWSMMRPNRTAMESDRGVWNTDVVEPQYHVGIVGFRKDQIRISRYDEHWGAAVSIERRNERTGSDLNFKVMRQIQTDGKRFHIESGGMAGRDRAGFMVSAIVPILKRLDFVTQEFWAHHTLNEALGIVPVGLSGTSFVEGLESHLTRTFEVYGYGGMVIASRTTAGNHHVWEATTGVQKLMPMTGRLGTARTCLQISRINRDIWTGREGGVTQVLVQFRYDLP